jgi:hypothetical protein
LKSKSKSRCESNNREFIDQCESGNCGMCKLLRDISKSPIQRCHFDCPTCDLNKIFSFR